MTKEGFGRKAALAAGGLFFALAVAWGGLFRTASADTLSFSGTVKVPSGNAFTDGGGVNLSNSTNGYWSGIQNDGTFGISGIAAGTYALEVGISQSSPYANPAQQQVTITASVTGFTITVTTPVIRGTLALPDGTPTSGCLDVHDPTWTIRQGSCPDSTGAFKIGALEAGTYLLSIYTPDNSPYVGVEQTITVTDPSTTLELGTVRFENPFVVGKVALPNGTLLTWNDDWSQRLHLSVDLWNSDNTINRHSNFDSESKFKFGRMPAGTYTIHVNIWDTELYTGSENQAITVTESGLDMTATPVRLTTPQLSGVVYLPDGVTPVQNVWVNLHTEDWSSNQGSSTDANGTYRIGGLAAGTYMLEANPPHDRTDMVRYEESGVVITSSLTTKNITMSAARKFVTGTVKRPNGNSVPCASVNANRRGGQGWAGTTTASDGSFTLTLSAGSWSVRVEPSNGWNCPVADWIFTNPELIVDFADDNSEQTETATFTVQKATAHIVGTVKTKSGAKITNGNINANSQTLDGRNRWSNAQIKADGTYTMNLLPGTYDLNVWTQDKRLFARNQKVAVGENETKTVDFTMNEKLALITGTVTDKAGRALGGIYLNGNLDCGPQGCSAWSDTQTASDGTYAMAVTEGRWNINFDSGRGAAYVYDGPMNEVYVPSETATVSGVNFELTYADVTVTGNVVDETGKTITDLNGWAYVRPTTVTAGNGMKEYGGGINQGSFTIRAPSSLFTIAELGVHMPQNSRYSSVAANVTLVADATIEQNIVMRQNDAAITGRIIDSSGLPLGKCDFRGEVFANDQRNQWHGAQINPDCTYEISLLAGTYNLGYHIDASSGILNKPMNERVSVASGTQLKKDLKVLTGDARITVFVVNPDGTPARHAWVWAGNHREIDEARRGAEQNASMDSFTGPGGTTSMKDMLVFCGKAENEKECEDFKLPPGSEGPGGCTDALACTKYCAKNKKRCESESKAGATVKTSSVVRLSASALERKARLAGLQSVTAQAESSTGDDPFANVIETGGETNEKGVATLSVISGHAYEVNAGVPPETGYVSPKEVEVNLADRKNANVTLALRQSDGRMSGHVLWNGVAVANGWVGCWSEDGGNTGSPILNGTYAMNYTFNSVYHCNANAFDGTTFLNADEKIVVIETKKRTTTNFIVGEARWQMPPPVSESFDATAAHVITLADGTTLNIPANALASSGTVTVNANPTVNVQSQKTAQPIGYAYNFDANDSDGKAITTFNSSVTMCFTYTDAMLADVGIEESALVSSYWDSSSGSWKAPENATQDQENNKICVSSTHFTSYAVVNKSGKGKGQNLTAVKTSRQKNGATKVTIGTGRSAKKIVPFPTYTGSVSVTTFRASKKRGQVIVATTEGGTDGATTLKVYTTKGKLSQKLLPWGSGYKAGGRVTSDELTKDAFADLIAAPVNGTEVKVVDMNKRKTHTVRATKAGSIVAQSINLKKRGTNQLAVTTGQDIETWDFVRGAFRKFGFDQRRLRVTGSSIERVTLQPNIFSVLPDRLSAKKKGTVTITVTGENFGSGSRVYLNQTIPAKKVIASGETKLVATFNAALLKKNKRYEVVVVNTDGEQTTSNVLRTRK